MKNNFLIYAFLVLLLGACNLKPTSSASTSEETSADTSEAVEETTSGQNMLTASEEADGWQLLFDGKTLDGWKNFRKPNIGSDWQVIDGELTLIPSPIPEGKWQSPSGGDIVTKDDYSNFHLKLEWKISACGNSGIMFNSVESDDYDFPWQTGPEMQILDNTCHPDAKHVKHRAGDLYDMISVKEVMKPAGEWNMVEIISDNGLLTFRGNGEDLLEISMNGKEWEDLIAGSKFKTMNGFGVQKSGRIALQDHGNEVAFRNIKIKRLD